MLAIQGATSAGITTAQAGRQLMWNLGATSHVLMYALMVVAFAVFAIGLRQRIGSWKRGKPQGEGYADWGRRFWILIREALLQHQTRRRFLPGLFHSLIFYSFLTLFVTTLIVMVDMDFGVRIYYGPFYLVMTLLADVAGGLLLIGLAVAAIRRYIARPAFLPKSVGADAVILGLLGFLVLTGFLTEGARIRFHPQGDPWSAFSPIGRLGAGLLAGCGPETGRAIHFATWWVHALATFTMIALIPQTKFFHMLSIPTNQFLARLGPKGALPRVDIEALLASEDASEDLCIGVSDGTHLTWKQRVDLSACIDCGRCDDVCPALRAGQPLSPHGMIADLEVLLQRGESRVAPAAQVAGAPGPPAAPNVPAEGAMPIVGAEGTVFSDPDFIWHCRTCHACQSICPAAIGHVELFVELRRAEVMMAGRIPGDAGRALKTMEAQGNPFGAQAERLDLVEKLEIPVIPPGGETEVLYWIGCGTTFDPEKHRIAADLVAILKHTGVAFGHLGRDETCCGDPARVLGDENLFQASAKQVIAALQARRFQMLLVSCPHGYNVMRNEYPQFGGHFPVVHHTELLARWICEGRLRPTEPVRRAVTFHDPCYLGRYQGICAPPRAALRALPGLALREMRDRGQESLCCGAGGGHFWMDLDTGDERPYTRRVDQAIACGADTIAVGCTFCYQMLTDGLKSRNLDEKIEVVDVASLVRRSLGI